MVKPKLESQGLWLLKAHYSPSHFPVSFNEKDWLSLHWAKLYPLKIEQAPQDDEIQADEGANNKPITVTNWMAVTGLQITAPFFSSPD